jgi:hypothetical protein
MKIILLAEREGHTLKIAGDKIASAANSYN